jgi:hypothetical protein
VNERRHIRAHTSIERPHARAIAEYFTHRSSRTSSRVELLVIDGMLARRGFGAMGLTEYSISRDTRKYARGATKDAVDGFVRINRALCVEIPLVARVGLALTNGFYWCLAWKLLRSTGAPRSETTTRLDDVARAREIRSIMTERGS